MENNQERLQHLTEEQHVPYIVHNYPKDNEELFKKWSFGYRQIYINPDKYTKILDNDPRISDKIKYYQNIVRTESVHALEKTINYTLYPY